MFLTFLVPVVPLDLCMDHVISTGRQMTNLVSNFESLFSFFQPTLKSDLKETQFTQNYLFWVKAHLWYLEGAPSFKTRQWLKNITITNIQNSTLNSSFDALSKWHDSDLDSLTSGFETLTSAWIRKLKKRQQYQIFKIRHWICHLTPCRNDMIQTLVEAMTSIILNPAQLIS